MGLRDLLARTTAGPLGLGNRMGRIAVEDGLALGRALYLGHGTLASSTPGAFVFEDAAGMKSAGFVPYCADPLHKPPAEDSSDLSIHARAAGVAIATRCSVTAVGGFMKKEPNVLAFNKAMGGSTSASLSRLGSSVTIQMVIRYLNLPIRPPVTQVLNLKNPGADDLFFLFLEEVTRQAGGVSVAFQRTGEIGFGPAAVALAQKAILTVKQAAQQFGW